MNKDQVKGRIEEAKGGVKEAAGKVAGNRTLAQKGRMGRLLGSVRAAYGDLKEDLKRRR